MKSFTVSVTATVFAYHTQKIEAETVEEAIAQIKTMIDDDTIWENLKPDWASADEHQIINICDLETKTTLHQNLHFGDQEWENLFGDPV